jgi:CheY-like chemotaxis protein
MHDITRPQPVSEPIDGDTCWILVVEDDPVLRTLISDFLRDEGFQVMTAATGAEALRIVEQECPRLILLDMHLPVMNGKELARELKSRRLDVPIVVMTAAYDARTVAEELGAVAYVSKPLSLPSLVRRLDGLGV